MNKPKGKFQNLLTGFLFNDIKMLGIVALFISVIAYFILYLYSSPLGNYHLFFKSTIIYFLVFLLYMIGTVSPIVAATFFHFEDFPIAPGGRVKKGLLILFLTIISFLISLIICKGVISLVGLQYNKTVIPLFYIFEFLLIVTLVSFSGSLVFNIRRRKAFIVVIPLIFTQLFFYFTLLIVSMLFKNTYFFSYIEIISILVLFFIPLVIYLSVQSKGGIKRLERENKFFNVDLPKGDTPEAAYRTALGFMETGRFQDALKYFNICLKDNNTILDAYLQRADVNLSLGKYEEAAADAETYIDAKARGLDERPYLILLHAYASMNEWDNVFDVSKELLRKFPSNIQGIYYSALSLKEQYENEKAVEVLSKIEDVWEGLPEYLQKTEKPFYKRAVKLLDELKNQNN